MSHAPVRRSFIEQYTLCAGSAGKTTTAWLIRGIFEEWGKLTGMAGTIENAIYADKLDEDGNLWAPDEPDPTLDRCAFRLLTAFCALGFQIYESYSFTLVLVDSTSAGE